MTPELRHRRKSDDSSNGEATATARTPPVATTATPITPIKRAMPVFVVSVHVAALVVVLVGLVLRFDFHSGAECDMTYSMRHFVEIKSSSYYHHRLIACTSLPTLVIHDRLDCSSRIQKLTTGAQAILTITIQRLSCMFRDIGEAIHRHVRWELTECSGRDDSIRKPTL